MTLAIVALTRGGGALARRLQAAIGPAVVHGLRARAAGDVVFTDAIAHLQALHRAGDTIVGVCAAGILIRALAAGLAHKGEDAPVVAVAEDGSVAVPLIGGHHGANDLARRIAAVTGGVAAITTAGDVVLGVALDQPPPGWRIANPDAIKPIAAALLADETIALDVDDGLEPGRWLDALPRAADSRNRIAISARVRAGALVYHPPVLAIGVGCERGAAPHELHALAIDTLAHAGLAPEAIACVASLDLKMDEPAVLALAERFDAPARFFPAATLARLADRLPNPSAVVEQAVGAPGVAEAAALAAAGDRATLIVPKRKSARTTCAIALSPTPIDPRAVGQARGRLDIVGIGPGGADWRTQECVAALQGADEVVGYRLYLDLVADLLGDKPRHESELGAEEARVRVALDRAAAGRRVALISSGDAGIYGLASLAYELIDREARADWARLDIHVCPGVSALQAAAARAGAPLGHDFCAISLSDLLTPWPVIENRLRAAASGDFVVALYNPASQRRADHFAQALAILGAARAPDTPVIIARNLGRAGETTRIVTLREAAADAIDMLTIVIIGSNATARVTQAHRPFVYTPRGYAAKAAP
jgi:cobalt-precorrin 5A hydrolase / precorrin-3B C17-methyltransferase